MSKVIAYHGSDHNINGIVRKIKPGLTFYIVYNPENIIP